MTTPIITLYPDTLPAKGQANAAFDLNVDNFLTWLTATNGPQLATMITYTEGVANTVLATALAGDLPALTGKAGDYIRANAAENGGEFRTPAEVLADIGATDALALKAPLASPVFTGAPTVPTATAGTNTAQAASTAFVTVAVAASPRIGVGQTWQDLSGSRAVDNTAYQNTTGVPIQVNVMSDSSSSENFSVSQDNVTWLTIVQTGGQGADTMRAQVIVPNGYYYRASSPGASASWFELR